MRTTLATLTWMAFMATAAIPAEGVLEDTLEKTGLKEGKSQLSSTDQTFVTKAAEGGMAEVEMAKLAKKNSESTDVQAFAQKMIDDHSKANEKLEKIASAKDAKLPTDPGAEHQKQLDELKALSGAKFDEKYMKMQVEGHEKMHALMEQQVKSGNDPDLKAFAKETLATVEEHAKLAKKVSSKS
jgi:putative membrane protein